MPKKIEFFIAQNALSKGWVTQSQLSHAMKLSKKNPEISFIQVLVKKTYISKKQVKQLYELWKKKSKEKQTTIRCPKCSSDNKIEDYQPDEEYLCPECSKELPPPKTQFDMSYEDNHSTSDDNTNDSGCFLTPQHFGHYKIIKEIGRGGMGIVYKVKHPDLEFPLALKVLLRNESRTSENVMRFYREIELASKLRHPNIVGIHDVGAFKGCPYFTMDYIEGQTLDKYLRKKAPLEEKLALEIIEKIASGLDCAHKANIIHRDLKPANVIIDKKNRAYLMDFGIAKCREKMFKKLTKTGTIMGTPDYMSPEQATGQVRLVKFESDVYALGATFYHMITGSTPFSGESPIDTITKVVNDHPIPPKQIIPEISRYTEAVIMKALSKQIKDRYPNAGAFALDIRALLSGKKTLAKPVSQFKLFIQDLKRNIVVLICSAITIIAILITIYFLMNAV